MVSVFHTPKFVSIHQNSDIIENKRGVLQDYKEIHESTLTSLERSFTEITSRNLIDSKTYP